MRCVQTRCEETMAKDGATARPKNKLNIWTQNAEYNARKHAYGMQESFLRFFAKHNIFELYIQTNKQTNKQTNDQTNKLPHQENNQHIPKQLRIQLHTWRITFRRRIRRRRRRWRARRNWKQHYIADSPEFGWNNEMIGDNNQCWNIHINMNRQRRENNKERQRENHEEGKIKYI